MSSGGCDGPHYRLESHVRTLKLYRYTTPRAPNSSRQEIPMTSLTRWVLRHKILVLPFWLILTVVGFASASSANNALSKQFDVPGGEGMQASAAILRQYGSGGLGSP